MKGLFTKVRAGIRDKAGESAAPGPYVPLPAGEGRRAWEPGELPCRLRGWGGPGAQTQPGLDLGGGGRLGPESPLPGPMGVKRGPSSFPRLLGTTS